MIEQEYINKNELNVIKKNNKENNYEVKNNTDYVLVSILNIRF